MVEQVGFSFVWVHGRESGENWDHNSLVTHNQAFVGPMGFEPPVRWVHLVPEPTCLRNSLTPTQTLKFH